MAFEQASRAGGVPWNDPYNVKAFTSLSIPAKEVRFQRLAQSDFHVLLNVHPFRAVNMARGPPARLAGQPS